MAPIDWTYIAATLVVPIVWGAVVHVIFQRFGPRPGRRREAGPDAGRMASGAADESGRRGPRPVDPDDDPAPEYQI
jgi:hypothetical protein